MNQKPNLIKLAVIAAGGREHVADTFQTNPMTVTNWQRRGVWPVEWVRRLCAMGENVISVDALLAYIEEAKVSATAKRRAEVEARQEQRSSAHRARRAEQAGA